jgi:hypothetical protein
MDTFRRTVYFKHKSLGEKSNRIGRILSIDIEKDAAVAKAEIIDSQLENLYRLFSNYEIPRCLENCAQILYTWREIANQKLE